MENSVIATRLIAALELKDDDIIVMENKHLPPIQSVEIVRIFEPAQVEVTFETGETATAAVNDEIRILERT